MQWPDHCIILTMDSIQRKDLNTEAQNKKSTEIDTLSISQILKLINSEDQSIPLKVAAEIDSIEKAVEICVDALRKGCKIFYIGASSYVKDFATFS